MLTCVMLTRVMVLLCLVMQHPVDKTRMRSSTIINNGLNPVWMQKFEFVVQHPGVAMLHIGVYHQVRACPAVRLSMLGRPVAHHRVRRRRRLTSAATFKLRISPHPLMCCGRGTAPVPCVASPASAFRSVTSSACSVRTRSDRAAPPHPLPLLFRCAVPVLL